MTLKVYHHKSPTFSDSSEDTFSLEDYVLVAVVEITDRDVEGALEKTFWLTNHIDRSWWENDSIVCHQPNARSTSMGDIVEIETTGTFYCCMRLGWKEIPSPKHQLLVENTDGLCS